VLGLEYGGRLCRERILGVTLHSTEKAHKKALSKEDLSNRSTSGQRCINKPELNLIRNTSSGSLISSCMRNLQKTSM
jgi:hypothetical protein